ncbi:MAG: histidinol-phosphatase [Alphaproteobacteria bacterium]|nr:histidinol-phosphatase [Alphaproteobacteria bacterium]
MYKEYSCFAEQLAKIASDEILPFFRKKIIVEEKNDTSPVTQADKNAELAMRKVIKEVYPNHGIVGEEYGIENIDAEYVWVLDPIDGTKSFITGSPLFGTLIALLHNKKPVVGIINQPFTKECWKGEKGKKSLYNGEIIETRKCKEIKDISLYSTGGRLMFKKAEDLALFEKLQKQVKVSRFSADCYGYGLLSMGCIDVVCEAEMKLYDYAALMPIVEGAGGCMTDWFGNNLSVDGDGHVLALGDKTLLPEVVKVLSK